MKRGEYKSRRKRRSEKWRPVQRELADIWYPCRECGKRTWPTRTRAREVASDHHPPARVYHSCDGKGYHLTSSDDAVRAAYYRDPSSVLSVADIPGDVLEIIEPRIMDLRYGGASMEDIAHEMKISLCVISAVLAVHDPLRHET